MKRSKKMINALIMEEHEAIFACPICTSEMSIRHHQTLICRENHSFDIAKQGYVHLAPQAHATKYDQSLFQARKLVMTSPFFQPLLQKLSTVIQQHNEGQSICILDAGCGEGSHLHTLVSNLERQAVGVGIDLSKEGILEAAKSYPGYIWSVADLAKCPFQGKQFDILLNILSPANYAEFVRVLADDGLFIKIVPATHYLQELRVAFDKEKESERAPIDKIRESFSEVIEERVTYKVPMQQELLTQLVKMTPLSWSASSEQIEEALNGDITHITIDVTLIIATK